MDGGRYGDILHTSSLEPFFKKIPVIKFMQAIGFKIF